VAVMSHLRANFCLLTGFGVGLFLTLHNLLGA
jgi:hypothetical protein